MKLQNFFLHITGVSALVNRLDDEINRLSQNIVALNCDISDKNLRIEYFEKRCIDTEKERDAALQQVEVLSVEVDKLEADIDAMKKAFETANIDMLEAQNTSKRLADDITKLLDEKEKCKNERFRMRDEIVSLKAELAQKIQESGEPIGPATDAVNTKGVEQKSEPQPVKSTRRKPRPYPKEKYKE